MLPYLPLEHKPWLLLFHNFFEYRYAKGIVLFFSFQDKGQLHPGQGLADRFRLGRAVVCFQDAEQVGHIKLFKVNCPIDYYTVQAIGLLVVCA